MFRKYEPSLASTFRMLAATALYHSRYLSGGIGLKPLVESYSRWVAYGGDVITTLALPPANSGASTVASLKSPQIRRCLGSMQGSPGRGTWCVGADGMMWMWACRE